MEVFKLTDLDQKIHILPLAEQEYPVLYSALPSVFPPFLNRKEIEIRASMDDIAYCNEEGRKCSGK